MKKQTKIIIGALVLGGLYLLYKRNQKNGMLDSGAGAATQPGNAASQPGSEVGSNETNTRRGVPNGWVDITRRKCIDGDGKIFYVNGPCPEVAANGIYAENINTLRR